MRLTRASRFGSILRARLPPRFHSLNFRQLLLAMGEKAGIDHLFARREGHYIGDPQIYADDTLGRRQRGDVFLHSEGNSASRPAGSQLMETVVGLQRAGKGRLQRMPSGTSIFANVSCVPPHWKAQAVYSAD